MSDILEDQKIHYIVKDYRRMFNEHNTLVDKGKELQKELKEKDAEIIILKSKIYELEAAGKQQKPPGRVRGILNNIEVMTNSVVNRLQQITETVNKINKESEELRQLINA